MKQQNFKVRNGLTENGKPNFDNHLIDEGGNHFVNGKCINPKRPLKIGSTYPPMNERIYKPKSK